MNVRFNLKIDRAKLDEMLAQWKPKAEAVLDTHAFAIEAGAKVGAPVLTGALRNSFQVVKPAWNTREIKDGVEYGVFQELGTSRGISAKYFLTSAAENQAEKFFSDLQRIFE